MNESIENKIASLAREITELKKTNPLATTIKKERIIDELLYSGFSLSNDEIQVIEDSTK